MLTDIYIRHFTLINQLELSLQPGMTVLTGETGAGKSIIIDAAGLALGDRATANLVHPDAEKAEIHLRFDITNIPAAQKWLEEHDMAADANECLIRRTIYRDGKSKSYINQIPVTLPLLRELAQHLINIHGQHEFQHLLKADCQRDLLDQHAKHDVLLQNVSALYQDWVSAQEKQKALQDQQKSSEQRADYLRFQLEELNELDLSLEELKNLEQKQKQLANVENLIGQTASSLDVLEEQDHAARSQLNFALQTIESVAHLHPQLQEAQQLLNASLLNCDEACNTLRSYAHHLEANPQELAMIEERLGKAHNLARKHRVSLDELVTLQQTMQEELNGLSNLDETIAQLDQAIKLLAENYFAQSAKLTQSREKHAKKLSEQITKNIQKLSMPNGKLSIELIPYTDATPRSHGMEKIQFLVSANPGQPLQPLQQVASGGELSRMSLAIQVITAQQSATPTLVFDEVDVGIGGATADIVGKLLRELGEKAQVFCITHLAQVAAKGHQHLRVEKLQQSTSTTTQIAYLDKEERIQEIARMSGGVEINQQTLAHAASLLES